MPSAAAYERGNDSSGKVSGWTRRRLRYAVTSRRTRSAHRSGSSPSGSSSHSTSPVWNGVPASASSQWSRKRAVPTVSMAMPRLAGTARSTWVTRAAQPMSCRSRAAGGADLVPAAQRDHAEDAVGSRLIEQPSQQLQVAGLEQRQRQVTAWQQNGAERKQRECHHPWIVCRPTPAPSPGNPKGHRPMVVAAKFRGGGQRSSTFRKSRPTGTGPTGPVGTGPPGRCPGPARRRRPDSPR